ncbi:hypothetical protein BpHYR1_024135 [Brachionus plicatilis]|uniref:Uncharacterized protein n=1 Tax=Brachionus plicatilis TaxID=10195 RepID=A0A3M7TAR4_BRAPC|nr:hypothetical protein BpHYR1_024135 [Brachionus plicatilis]
MLSDPPSNKSLSTDLVLISKHFKIETSKITVTIFHFSKKHKNSKKYLSTLLILIKRNLGSPFKIAIFKIARLVEQKKIFIGGIVNFDTKYKKNFKNAKA